MITPTKNCRDCPLGGKLPGVDCVTSRSADLMVVGMAPGYKDVKNGMAFSDNPGLFLEACLAAAGLQASRIHMTYLVKHWPKRSPDSTPAYAIEACSKYFLEEWEAVQPKLIVAIGAKVMAYFGIKGGINQSAGFIFDTNWGRVMPILNPSGLMQAANMRNASAVMTSMHRITTELNGALVPPAFQDEHIHGGGVKENKIFGDVAVYRKALRGEPGYQVLCANCNWIKRYE